MQMQELSLRQGLELGVLKLEVERLIERADPEMFRHIVEHRSHRRVVRDGILQLYAELSLEVVFMELHAYA